MSNLNQCNFIGRLGKDPETRFLPSGKAVTNISIAISDKWKDKNTGQPQEHTEWINVSAFDKLAEIMGQYLKKGSLVYISGAMRTRKYQDAAGVDKYSTSITAKEMKMLDSKPADQNQNSGENRPTQATSNTVPQNTYDDFEDCPF